MNRALKAGGALRMDVRLWGAVGLDRGSITRTHDRKSVPRFTVEGCKAMKRCEGDRTGRERQA